MKIRELLDRLANVNWKLAYVPWVNRGLGPDYVSYMGKSELESARDELNAILVQMD